MNNEEKILSMLAQIQSDMTQMQSDMTQMRSDMTQMQSDMTQMKSDMSDMKATQAEQGDRLCRLEMSIEHTVIPRLDALYEGHMLLRETLASKEDVEKAIGTANFALSAVKTHTQELKTLTAQVDKLEKAN